MAIVKFTKAELEGFYDVRVRLEHQLDEFISHDQQKRSVYDYGAQGFRFRCRWRFYEIETYRAFIGRLMGYGRAAQFKLPLGKFPRATGDAPDLLPDRPNHPRLTAPAAAGSSTIAVEAAQPTAASVAAEPLGMFGVVAHSVAEGPTIGQFDPATGEVTDTSVAEFQDVETIIYHPLMRRIYITHRSTGAIVSTVVNADGTLDVFNRDVTLFGNTAAAAAYVEPTTNDLHLINDDATIVKIRLAADGLSGAIVGQPLPIVANPQPSNIGAGFTARGQAYFIDNPADASPVLYTVAADGVAAMVGGLGLEQVRRLVGGDVLGESAATYTR